MKIPDYNKKTKDLTYLEMIEEIKRLKEEYVMLQNASDEVEEELQQRIDKAIEYINWNYNHYRLSKVFNDKILSILQGSDKE